MYARMYSLQFALMHASPCGARELSVWIEILVHMSHLLLRFFVQHLVPLRALPRLSIVYHGWHL